MTATESIQEYMSQCNGFETTYKNWLRGVYSEGVKFVADQAGAHWLIDAIFSHQSAKVKAACAGFQHWTLTRNKTGSGAVLTCTDGGRGGKPKIVVKQNIEYTDFPMPSIEMYLECGVLMLKAER